MTDLEKTLDDLKLLNALCHGTVLDDAIALLKEQEAVYPSWQNGKMYCGHCGSKFPTRVGMRYCHRCGKPIKLKVNDFQKENTAVGE